MATYKTTGIVIGRHNFGEADRVVVLLTPDRGVLRVVAKGLRRIKSRMAGHLELFCESDLMLVEGKNMDIITSARLQHHVSLGDDYDRMRLAYLIAEMVGRLGGDGDHPGLFELVQAVLAAIGTSNSGESSTTLDLDLLELWFKLRLLEVLGYRPQLDACVVCGTNDSARHYSFSFEKGGIVDGGCADASNPSLSHDQIKLWRICLARDYSVVAQVGEGASLATPSLVVCDNFYLHIFGKKFRSDSV